jgi:magnesium transporter
MLGRGFGSATEVAVVESDVLVGLVSIERLIGAPPRSPIRTLMERDPPSVLVGSDPARAVHALGAKGGRSVAVLGEDGEFRGLLSPASLLAHLDAEHHEDLARLGGYVAGADRARTAAEEPIRRRLAHRIPWLLIGLVGAMASALIVGAFESKLESNLLIAFFVPAVVYMADAVGTQTETVLIRGLAAGITPLSVMRRELITGLAMGAMIGSAFLAFAAIGWGDVEIAVAVAIALFASCSIATAVAMVLPAAFQRLGADPAFGSGPLATVVQDLLSIIVYFVSVAVIVG